MRSLTTAQVNAVTAICFPTTSPSTRQESETQRVLITVRDEGQGIPEADLAHILDPFYTTKRDTGGTGLGLAVAGRIVDEHQGHLSFDSEVGRGTKARLALPLYVEEDV